LLPEVEDMAPPYAASAVSSARQSLEGPRTLSRVNHRTEPTERGVEGLATALLDLGSGYEARLRTVMSMQRILERVRRCRQRSPEAALLVQEMTRLCQALGDRDGALAECIRTAEEHLATLECGTG
jgi:hypothetical protein